MRSARVNTDCYELGEDKMRRTMNRQTRLELNTHTHDTLRARTNHYIVQKNTAVFATSTCPLLGDQNEHLYRFFKIRRTPSGGMFVAGSRCSRSLASIGRTGDSAHQASERDVPSISRTAAEKTPVIR